MVNLLRFLKHGIRDRWFVIDKQFGLPTLKDSSIACDLTNVDTVMNRLLIMGYESISREPHLYATENHQQGADGCNIYRRNPPSSEVLGEKQPHLSFCPIWNMSSECRGILAIAQGAKSIEFFHECERNRLIHRKYAVLVESDLLEKDKPSKQVGEAVEGHTLRSDLFYSPGKSNLKQEERIFSLFQSNEPQESHPWLPLHKRLSVLPYERFAGKKGKYFCFRPKLIKAKIITKSNGSKKLRQIFEVEFNRGTEADMRCAFAHLGFPILNDPVYNHQYAVAAFNKFASHLRNGVKDPEWNEIQERVEKGMLEDALNPIASNSLHIGICCIKVTFPDPSDMANEELMRDLNVDDNKENINDIASENAQYTKIEIPIPAEFDAWIEGDNLPADAAKNGIRPLQDPQALATQLIKPEFINGDIAPREDDSAIMVSAKLGMSQATVDAGSASFLSSQLVECKASLGHAKNTKHTRLASKFPRTTLLCSHCGDFHHEAMCPSANSAIKPYDSFAQHASQGGKNPSFCITCGTFGHLFYGCVHSYSKFRIQWHDSSAQSTTKGQEDVRIKTKWPSKARQCQVCESIDHREIQCARRKIPPWGYDELGAPIRKTQHSKLKRQFT